MSDDGFGILIDTNAMSALSLYVEACNTVEKELGITIDDLKNAFEERGCKEQYLNFGEVKKGYALYNYLSDKLREFDDEIQVWFCLMSEIELLNVFMEKVFDNELTKKGIPYRIRQKKPFRTQIDFDYENAVTNYWNNIRSNIENHNIVFSEPEKIDGTLQNVLNISRIVTKYVALAPVDLYLYATAIYLRVQGIYTHDNEFKTIINDISHRNGTDWTNIYNSIQNDLIKFIHSFADEFEKEGKIDLPNGIP